VRPLGCAERWQQADRRLLVRTGSSAAGYQYQYQVRLALVDGRVYTATIARRCPTTTPALVK